jgi:hypothetical protein
VEIIGRRRRFYKLRTGTGVVGWADSWQLLSTEGMESLRDMARQTAEAPSQGQATVFDPLNVHTAPNRQAPTIFQITPGGMVDVIAYQSAPRATYKPPTPLMPALAPEIAAAKKPKRAPEYPPPPRPAAPAPPRDWIDLSGGVPPARETATPAAAGAPVVNEIWSLVRSREGRTGWVLARMLLMALPDEVAQYAERARIAAFFQVGETVDKAGASHPAWLWATAARSGSDFDCLRLFTWNTRRDRYETSYIERNLNGFLPIRIDRRQGGGAIEFTAVLTEKDGSLQTRVYSINGFRVRLAGRRPATLPRTWYNPADFGARPEGPAQTSPVQRNWRDRLPAWVPFLSRSSR